MLDPFDLDFVICLVVQESNFSLELFYPSSEEEGLVLIRISIAVMKHHNKSNLGRKVFLSLTLPHHSPSLKEAKAGSQDRNLEAGAEAEVIEEYCLHICSP